MIGTDSKPAPEENKALYDGVFENERQHAYHAMVNRIDWNVGRLLSALDAHGLSDNTIVVFTSDHGENHPLSWNKHPKRLCYDQSANVPLIIRAPGVIWPRPTMAASSTTTANTLISGWIAALASIITQPVSSVDLCPTILDLLGYAVPEGIHGRSMKMLLSGDVKGWRPEVFIQNRPYNNSDKMVERCIVTEDWKLILNAERPPELYDRTLESKDRDNRYSKVGRAVELELMEMLSRWGKYVEDPLVAKLVERHEED